MLTDQLITLFFIIPSALIAMLPTVNATIPDGAFTTVNDTFAMVAYILPLSDMLIPFGIVVALRTLQITISIIIRIKSFIPTMGA